MSEKRGYRIASFNIENFSFQSVFSASESECRKDIKMIAQIIQKNDIDIIAIQEISHPYALKLLLQELCSVGIENANPPNKSNLTRVTYGYSTRDWEGRWAKPVSKYSDLAAEGYALIWNKQRIKLVTNYEGEVFEPRIGFNLQYGQLVRPPFIGRFMPIKGRFEFRIINAHFAWEPPKNANNDQIQTAHKSSIAFREHELESLFSTVYSSLAKKQYDVNREDRHARPLTPYTFLLGDYNMNLTGMGEGATMPKEYLPYECGDLQIVTVNSELTTLKKLPRDPDKIEEFRSDCIDDHHLANNYDHFSYDQRKYVSHEIADPLVSVVAAYKNYEDKTYENTTGDYQAKFDLYKKKISDHLPIILDIDVREKRK